MCSAFLRGSRLKRLKRFSFAYFGTSVLNNSDANIPRRLHYLTTARLLDATTIHTTDPRFTRHAYVIDVSLLQSIDPRGWSRCKLNK